MLTLMFYFKGRISRKVDNPSTLWNGLLRCHDEPHTVCANAYCLETVYYKLRTRKLQWMDENYLVLSAIHSHIIIDWFRILCEVYHHYMGSGTSRIANRQDKTLHWGKENWHINSATFVDNALTLTCTIKYISIAHHPFITQVSLLLFYCNYRTLVGKLYTRNVMGSKPNFLTSLLLHIQPLKFTRCQCGMQGWNPWLVDMAIELHLYLSLYIK